MLTGLILASTSGQEYDPDRIIVKLAPDISRNDFRSILDTNNYVVEKVLVRRLNILSIKLKNNQIFRNFTYFHLKCRALELLEKI